MDEKQTGDESECLGSPPEEEVLMSSITASIHSMSMKSSIDTTSKPFPAQHLTLETDQVDCTLSEVGSSSRHEVLSSSIQKTGKVTVTVDAQTLNFKHQLEKKEKSLKVAKQQTVAVTSELEASKKENQSLENRIQLLDTERKNLRVENRQLRQEIKENADAAAKLGKLEEIIKNLQCEHDEEQKV